MPRCVIKARGHLSSGQLGFVVKGIVHRSDSPEPDSDRTSNSPPHRVARSSILASPLCRDSSAGAPRPLSLTRSRSRLPALSTSTSIQTALAAACRATLESASRTAGRAVDQDLLTRPQPARVAQAVQGGDSGCRRRRRFLECQVRRLARQLVLAGARVLRARTLAGAEHLVADLEGGDIGAHGLDPSRDVGSGHAVLGPQQARSPDASAAAYPERRSSRRCAGRRRARAPTRRWRRWRAW